MSSPVADPNLAPLDALVGEWSMEARFEQLPPTDDRGQVIFEWMTGGRFLVERWEVPVPEAPDGVALIGRDERGNTDHYLQHYFDSRGVARVYKMTIEKGIWKLWRDEPDFSPLDFAQRYTGELSEDGSRIDGQWEIKEPGEDWRVDFTLNYVRR